MVLVIDNDPTFARQIKVALQHNGMLAEFATDGFAGIAMVRDLQPAVVLIDILMPGADGVQVAKEIRDIAPDSTLILMSGDLGAIGAARAEIRGAYAIIDKPIPLSALVRYVGSKLPS